jgi:opacity protein-like surface antigen
MTLKLSALSAFAAATVCAAPALAEDQMPGAYVQLNIGAGVGGETDIHAIDNVLGSGRLKEDTKVGPFVSGAAGWSLSNGVAIEGELLYLQNKIDTPDANEFFDFPFEAQTKTYALMVNAMYAIGRWDMMVPYVGAGVGVGKTNYKVLAESDDDTGFIWQLRAGVSFPVNPSTSWDLGYRYIEAPEFNKTYTFDDGAGGTEITTLKAQTGRHVLQVGWRYRY